MILERDGEDNLGLSYEEINGTTYIPKERSTIHKITPGKDTWICHILHRNCLLRYIIVDKIAVMEDEEEDVSSYRMTLRKEKILELELERANKNCTLCGTSYRGAMDLSQGRLNFDVTILRNRKYKVTQENGNF